MNQFQKGEHGRAVPTTSLPSGSMGTEVMICTPFPSPPVAVRRVGTRVMRAGDLSLSLAY